MCAGDPIRPNYESELYVPILGDFVSSYSLTSDSKGKNIDTRYEVPSDERFSKDISLAPSYSNYNLLQPSLLKSFHSSSELNSCPKENKVVKVLSYEIQREKDEPLVNSIYDASQGSKISLKSTFNACSQYIKIYKSGYTNIREDKVDVKNAKKIKFGEVKCKTSWRHTKDKSKNFQAIKKPFVKRNCDTFLNKSNLRERKLLIGTKRRRRLKNIISNRFEGSNFYKKSGDKPENLKKYMKINELSKQSSYKSSQYKPSCGDCKGNEFQINNSKFSNRKPSRRNSTSQLYSENSNGAMLKSKNSKRDLPNVQSSASFEERLSLNSQFYKSSSGESSREATGSTIRLIDKIDKYLNILSDQEQERTLDHNPRDIEKRVSSNDSKRRIPIRRNLSEDRSIKINDDSEYLLSQTKKTEKRKQNLQMHSASSQSLTNYENETRTSGNGDFVVPETNRHVNINYQTDLTKQINSNFSDNEIRRRNRMYSSLDGLTGNSSCLFGERLLTAAFLARIDNALTDLVDEEKLKIQNSSRSLNASYEALSIRRQKSRDNLLRHKKYESNQVLIRVKPAIATDLLDKHKRFFTAKKPFKPRILKSDSKSQLKPFRIYKVTRIKRKKKKKVEENLRYSDDFESPHSSQDTSSDQESIEEDLHLSSSSLNNSREEEVEPNVILEDEEDTCYGSDQIGSEMINEQMDSFKEETQTQNGPREFGEISIDSAYTGSREATPDIHAARGDLNKNVKVNLTENANTFSLPRCSYSLTKRINDLKKFLCEKIKESGIYSDSHINNLLDYYKQKWTHIPEREMNIIISFIRRDLGVIPPPKVCLDQLLTDHNKANSNTMDALSREQCLRSLSNSLPRYLKLDPRKRTTLSASCSPEPPNYALRKGKSSSSSPVGSMSFTGTFKQHKGKKSAKTRFLESVKDLSLSEKEEQQASKQLHSFDESFNDEEEWVRKNFGEEMLQSVKESLDDVNSPAYDFFTSTQDIEKMANELCEQFGLVL